MVPQIKQYTCTKELLWLRYLAFNVDDQPMHPRSPDRILSARSIRIYHHQGVESIPTGTWVNHFWFIFDLGFKK
jgi:hypothetical protein